MIDVSAKFNTLRYAKAEGKLFAKPETIALVKKCRIPKGDLMQVARAAGISAAKKTADWIVFCHPISVDWIEVQLVTGEGQILITAEVRSVWKTGVEMEALTAVSAALLNAYDMLKPLDNSLRISDISLVKKKGGKSDYSNNFEKTLRTAVLVISDSTFAGTRKDKSGLVIQEFLQSQPVEISIYDILPDEKQKIEKKLIDLIDKNKIDLIFTTGGTGLGPKDVTPEATKTVIEREVPGIAEAIRKHGKERTPFAMLSRGVCGVRSKSLIINLPGSSSGAKESLEALFPGVLHIFPMLYGEGH